MHNFRRALNLAAIALAIHAAAPAIAADADPLLAALEASKASGKGLTLFVGGQAIPGVVVSVDDKYVVARSTASGTIVVRRERIDGVAGHLEAASGRR